jgi:TetR/AcrR family transcriptional repressor of nem operon
MRISKEKAAENKAALIRAASKLFRERGIDGVGVAEISKEAGLTHGALYAHFKSKEELALAALKHGFEQSHAGLAIGSDGDLPDLARYLDDCLSIEGRDDYGRHCPMSASASEIGRQDKALSAGFAEGFMTIARVFERHIGTDRPDGEAMSRAMVTVCTMVGGIAVARGTAKGDPDLSERILVATRAAVDELMLGAARGTPSAG